MADLIGKSLGRYHILEQLGQGGMATVFKAYDTRLERDVAVKIIRTGAFPPDQIERTLARFDREAKAVARLSHPNIVGVIDYGDHEGAPYLVMEYLPGGTLKGYPGKPMPWQDAVRIILPIAEALEYAHAQKIVHRDVKPSNILLTAQGQPMLTDFGIAKILESDDSGGLTATGVGMGTPEYMAPEQVDARTVDGRADIYSLGIVLYELVTGRPPYTADTPVAVMIMQMTDPLPRPARFVLGIPDPVEKILTKALAKKPEERYQAMGEVVKALRALLSGQVDAPPDDRTVDDLAAVAPAAAAVAPVADAKPAAAPSPKPARPAPQKDAAGILLPLGEDASLELVEVPAGEFEMGSQAQANSQPPHLVRLDAFRIGRFPVTNRQYAAFVRADGHRTPTHWRNGEIPPGLEDHPVVHLTWGDALSFCLWAEKVSGLAVRLPSEAEWEKAARGSDGRPYPWGSQPPDRGLCNFGSNESGTTPVGRYSPQGDSPYGCADMLGNVWEWCADWYGETYYLNAPPANPAGPEHGTHRVLRGGAWYGSALSIHAAFRGGSSPGSANVNIGFRVVVGGKVKK